ncbi:MAG: septum site-determining protein MinC [Sporomusaceae bacterium]|nr:septum site-determining protein MinC [Sporomusaceae bacterium]
MRKTVVFKGYRDGIELIIDQSADFSAILAQLRTKLESAANFFMAGAVVKVPTAPETFSESQKGQLYSLLADYGLTMQEVVPDESAALSEKELDTSDEFLGSESYQTNALVVRKTLRSGQVIKYTGSVVILGDVNPGAEVVADEDIMIFGVCRGIVHAGASGNEAATIMANRLQAMQIRIAGLIARAPDERLEPPGCSELARIVEGQVVIEPVNK